MMDGVGDDERLAGYFGAAERILVFTGAGLSTASGIPDFRGPNGVWTQRSPVYYQTFLEDEAARRDYWAFKEQGYAAFRDAQPNAGHHAIVELERAGKLLAVVTQNVDGLHQASGLPSDKVIELHGTNREVECVECRRRESPKRCMAEFAATGRVPLCRDCAAPMKPAVVMFGQSLDASVLQRAFAASEQADLVLALGSSLVVTPAAEVPLAAARRGVPYIIVNQGDTAHDGCATLRLEADVSELLPRALARWRSGAAHHSAVRP